MADEGGADLEGVLRCTLLLAERAERTEVRRLHHLLQLSPSIVHARGRRGAPRLIPLVIFPSGFSPLVISPSPLRPLVISPPLVPPSVPAIRLRLRLLRLLLLRLLRRRRRRLLRQAKPWSCASQRHVLLR